MCGRFLNIVWNTPYLMPSLINTKIALVAGGTSSVYALGKTGTVYVMGLNFFGELGLGHNQRIMNTTTINPFFDDAIVIYAGPTIAFVQVRNGSFYGMGTNKV